MVIVDGIQVTLLEGDGVLVATQVFIIIIIVNIFIQIIAGRQRGILLGCRLSTSSTYLILPILTILNAFHH